MGAQAQSQNSSQVYYDPNTSQYFTYQENKPQNPFSNLWGFMGLQAPGAEKNYLGSSLISSNKFTPKYTSTNYPDMNTLFPALNAGLLQGISSSVQPTGAMYGAGRFLSPQTTSESKDK